MDGSHAHRYGNASCCGLHLVGAPQWRRSASLLVGCYTFVITEWATADSKPSRCYCKGLAHNGSKLCHMALLWFGSVMSCQSPTPFPDTRMELQITPSSAPVLKEIICWMGQHSLQHVARWRVIVFLSVSMWHVHGLKEVCKFYQARFATCSMHWVYCFRLPSNILVWKVYTVTCKTCSLHCSTN